MTPFSIALKSEIDESVVVREDKLNRSKFRFGVKRKMSSKYLGQLNKKSTNDSKATPKDELPEKEVESSLLPDFASEANICIDDDLEPVLNIPPTYALSKPSMNTKRSNSTPATERIDMMSAIDVVYQVNSESDSEQDEIIRLYQMFSVPQRRTKVR